MAQTAATTEAVNPPRYCIKPYCFLYLQCLRAGCYTTREVITYNLEDSLAKAREEGWWMDTAKDVAYCPKCVKAGHHNEKETP